MARPKKENTPDEIIEDQNVATEEAPKATEKVAEQKDEASKEVKEEIPEEKKEISERVKEILKVFNKYEKLYISSTYGVYTSEFKDSILYQNPYYNK